MPKVETKVETTWICDICDVKTISPDYGTPKGWYDLAIGIADSDSDSGVNWRHCWRGTICEQCYACGIKTSVISRPEVARPLLKRIFAQFRKRR